MKKFILLAMAPVFLLTACSQGRDKVRTEVQSAVDDNAAAKSLADWHISTNNPEKLFSRWNSGMVSGEIEAKDVCATLQETEPEKLTLFEDQVQLEGNNALLKDCQGELKQKIENYWKEQRQEIKKLEEQKKNEPVTEKTVETTAPQASDDTLSRTKFRENIQYRDTSHGYFAITADVGPKEVLITFDDGPHPKNTPMILETLKTYNAKALFFEQGKNVKAYPETVRKVAAGGHSIGSHSMTHLCLPMKQRCASNNGRMLTDDEAIAQIRDAHQAIYNVLGWVDPFFRFPFGESSTELKQFLSENSTGEFYWSVDSEDWKAKTPQAVVDDTMNQLRKRGKGNILFHDIQRRTAEALPLLLQTLLKEGYSVVLLKAKDEQRIRYNNPMVDL